MELACILAAGEGTRIDASAEKPKSLVRVAGRPLIDLQLDRLARVGVERVIVVIRPEHDRVAAHLDARRDRPETEVVRCASRGGAETLFASAPVLSGSPFLLCTIDSFYALADLAAFVRACERDVASTMKLAVTPRASRSTNDVGVVLDQTGRVIDIGKHLEQTEFVCEGPMWSSALLFEVADLNMAGPSMSLTTFQRGLVEVGVHVTASVIKWAMDVDTATDVYWAEQWLQVNPLEK
jgi:NDP-sugar pyrophosphorylase family protein